MVPEFKRTVLEVSSAVEENRNHFEAKFSIDYPASFMLVASMNPCPCGLQPPRQRLRLWSGVVQKYLNKVSGPLLDRIDIHLEVTPVPFKELTSQRNGERSEVVRDRVVRAREIQAVRFTGMNGMYANAQMGSKLLHSVCELTEDGRTLLKTAMERLGLSARAYDRILKVS